MTITFAVALDFAQADVVMNGHLSVVQMRDLLCCVRFGNDLGYSYRENILHVDLLRCLAARRGFLWVGAGIESKTRVKTKANIKSSGRGRPLHIGHWLF